QIADGEYFASACASATSDTPVESSLARVSKWARSSTEASVPSRRQAAASWRAKFVSLRLREYCWRARAINAGWQVSWLRLASATAWTTLMRRESVDALVYR